MKYVVTVNGKKFEVEVEKVLVNLQKEEKQ